MNVNEPDRIPSRNLVAAALTAVATAACAHAPPSAATPGPAPSVPSHSGYADVDGLHLYYEVHGTGAPLVLIHGAFGATGMFGPNLDLLGAHRQVIAVDMQAHGRTADIDRPLSVEAMADDVAALIASLGFEAADVMGYSMGGLVAMQTAFRHPERVRRLIVVSSPFARSGWYPEMVAGMDQMGPAAAEPMKQSPMYAMYAAVAPRPDDWPRLVTKLGLAVKLDYDWSQAVAALKQPTLLVVGDADGVRLAHAVEFFRLLGGGLHDAGWDGSARPASRLAILPGATHYDIFASPALAAAVEPFLAAADAGR
ncbi:MAG: alpha/beta hydrolase [Myxococcota bacterium]